MQKSSKYVYSSIIIKPDYGTETNWEKTFNILQYFECFVFGFAALDFAIKKSY